ncbi:MAG: ATP-dependent DNA ligase, partial [Actinobacteria bacterium]|nr:ATP-dependent DNA ligase [Actinomycetota bacterium]
MASKKVMMKVGRRSIGLSNPDKVLWPKEGLTKTDLFEYYRDIAPAMGPYVADRLLTMERFPDGITGKMFFQKDASKHFPDWIERQTVGKRGGGTVDHVVGAGPVLPYLATQGTITVHMSLNT